MVLSLYYGLKVAIGCPEEQKKGKNGKKKSNPSSYAALFKKGGSVMVTT